MNCAIISSLAHCGKQLPTLLSTPHPEGSIHTLCHIMAVLHSKPSVTFQNKTSRVPIHILQSPVDVAPALSDFPSVTQSWLLLFQPQGLACPSWHKLPHSCSWTICLTLLLFPPRLSPQFTQMLILFENPSSSDCPKMASQNHYSLDLGCSSLVSA